MPLIRGKELLLRMSDVWIRLSLSAPRFNFHFPLSSPAQLGRPDLQWSLPLRTRKWVMTVSVWPVGRVAWAADWHEGEEIYRWTHRDGPHRSDDSTLLFDPVKKTEQFLND